MDDDLVDELVREQILFSRFALHNVAPKGRDVIIERSALVLIARLHHQGPMSVAELAESFELDVSTIHRQTAAAMRSGLLERIPDPAGGIARKLRATAHGLERFEAELSARRASLLTIMADWSPDVAARFTHDLRRFNEAVEQLRGRSWPRD